MLLNIRRGGRVRFPPKLVNKTTKKRKETERKNAEGLS